MSTNQALLLLKDGKGANLSERKGVVADDGQLIVFDLRSGYGLIFSPSEVDELTKAKGVML